MIATELKPIEIVFKILKRIEQENTGTRSEFAAHLGISPTWVTKYIRKIESELDVKIAYSRVRETYYAINTSKKYPPPHLFRIFINIHKSVWESVGFLNGGIFAFENKVHFRNFNNRLILT